VANWYQSAIGVLRWAVELGRIDITTETSMLAAQMAFPREGHLIAVLRIFSYLKKHHNARIAFDPTYPTTVTIGADFTHPRESRKGPTSTVLSGHSYDRCVITHTRLVGMAIQLSDVITGDFRIDIIYF
jgi:hypothetical protein